MKKISFLFILISLVASCRNDDFPKLRADEEVVIAKSEADNKSEIKKNDGKVIIASVKNAEVDEKKKIVEAVKEIPSKEKDAGVIFASAAKSDKNVKEKAILKRNKKIDLASRLNEQDKSTINKKVLSPKEIKKIEPTVEEKSEILSVTETTTTQSVEPSVTYQLDTFYFDNGSSVVKSDYTPKIKEIARIAKSKNAYIYVLGYASSRTNDTDYVSHKMANFKVSLARAENVAEALIKAGMNKDKVILEALSDTRPAYLEVMPEGERLNRRVELYIGY